MITLEEICCYLPYGLKVASIKPDWTTIFEMDTYSNMRGSGIEKRDIHSVISNQYKPLLRPLSDLTREIEHNGEKFVPIEWLEEKYYTLNIHQQAERIAKDSRWVNHCEYLLIQHLFEWHFDIYDLHLRGDCIYYNEIQ